MEWEAAMTWIERLQYPVQCQACGYRFHAAVGRLQHSPTLSCPACQDAIPVDGEAAKKLLGWIGGAMDLLRGAFQRFDKGR
jgi:hypothetical protein